MKRKITAHSSKKTVYQLSSLTVYILTIIVASVLLLVEPNNFDARIMIAPLVLLLLASAVGVGYKVASNSKSAAMLITGTIAMAVLLTFVGFFIVAAVGWFVGYSHAQ